MAEVAEPTAGPSLTVEERRAQRLQRQQARFRNRGGIFVPNKGPNTLIDVLLARSVTGESPTRSPVANNETLKGKGKERQQSEETHDDSKLEQPAPSKKRTAGSSKAKAAASSKEPTRVVKKSTADAATDTDIPTAQKRRSKKQSPHETTEETTAEPKTKPKRVTKPRSKKPVSNSRDESELELVSEVDVPAPKATKSKGKTKAKPGKQSGKVATVPITPVQSAGRSSRPAGGKQIHSYTEDVSENEPVPKTKTKNSKRTDSEQPLDNDHAVDSVVHTSIKVTTKPTAKRKPASSTSGDAPGGSTAAKAKSKAIEDDESDVFTEKTKPRAKSRAKSKPVIRAVKKVATPPNSDDAGPSRLSTVPEEDEPSESEIEAYISNKKQKVSVRKEEVCAENAFQKKRLRDDATENAAAEENTIKKRRTVKKGNNEADVTSTAKRPRDDATENAAAEENTIKKRRTVKKGNNEADVTSTAKPARNPGKLPGEPPRPGSPSGTSVSGKRTRTDEEPRLKVVRKKVKTRDDPQILDGVVLESKGKGAVSRANSVRRGDAPAKSVAPSNTVHPARKEAQTKPRSASVMPTKTVRKGLPKHVLDRIKAIENASHDVDDEVDPINFLS